MANAITAARSLFSKASGLAKQQQNFNLCLRLMSSGNCVDRSKTQPPNRHPSGEKADETRALLADREFGAGLHF